MKAEYVECFEREHITLGWRELSLRIELAGLLRDGFYSQAVVSGQSAIEPPAEKKQS